MAKKRGPEEGVLDYLTQQNRPYSAVDIFNNLHKEFGKTAVVKALETLAENGKVTEKVYGKQKVYAPLQDQYGEYNDEELKAFDKQAMTLQEQLGILQQRVKKQEDEISRFNSQVTTEEALKRITLLEEENENFNSRIDKLKKGTVLMSKAEREKIYKRKDKVVQQWRKRKRMTNDIVNAILEGYPKSKRELLEETGVETDEDVGVSIPS